MTINTIISSVPFFANWMWSVVYSKGLQWARSKDLISLTLARYPSVLTEMLTKKTYYDDFKLVENWFHSLWVILFKIF